jgi:hypothetical protein
MEEQVHTQYAHCKEGPKTAEKSFSSPRAVGVLFTGQILFAGQILAFDNLAPYGVVHA